MKVLMINGSPQSKRATHPLRLEEMEKVFARGGRWKWRVLSRSGIQAMSGAASAADVCAETKVDAACLDDCRQRGRAEI